MYVHKCFFRLRKVEMRIMIKLEKIKLPFIRTKIISQFVQFYEYIIFKWIIVYVDKLTINRSEKKEKKFESNDPVNFPVGG